MTYTVLAVKWRPKRFDELVGQAHVVTALVNSLQAERLHHAYLFSGTRGVGKTTIARLLAKALNCERGVSDEPCGECDACVSIDEGRFVDLIEVDAASRTKVDDTRELLDNVQYMPTRGRFKVYLVDEVHMLSNHSFNALLKTLEEPPPHVKFLFATTDPQKLPVTVLSRCLQFNLKKLPPGQILGQLRRICDAESVEAEEGGLQAMARAANGSMRDALSLLDQGIAFGGGTVTESEAKGMLGTIDRGHVVRLIGMLADEDGAGLLDEVAELDALAPDYGAVLEEIMTVLQRIAMAQLVGDERLEDDEAALRDLAGRMTPEDVQLHYQIAVNGRRDLALAGDERISFEMTLLRMLAFTIETARAASGGTPRRPAPSTRERSPKGGPEADDARREAEAAGPARRGSGRSRADDASADRQAERPGSDPAPRPGNDPAQRRGNDPVDPSTGDRPERSAAAGEPRAVNGVRPLAELAADWPGLLRAAGIRGPARSLAEHCVVSRVDGDRLELMLASTKADFSTEQLRERLRSGLSRHLGSDVRLSVIVGDPAAATPAQIREAGESARMREAREAIERDPTVRKLQEAFDAVVEPDSIEPPRE